MKRFWLLPLLFAGCGLDTSLPAPVDSGAVDAGSWDAGPADAGVLRVLFVGNSYTEVNALPSVVASLGQRLEFESMTTGGARLIDQWPARQRLSDGGFNVVVLQGQSLEPILSADDFYLGASTLSEAARDADTRVIWFETWPRRAGDPLYTDETFGSREPDEMRRQLSDRYHYAQQFFGGEVAEVGNVWGLFGPELYADDGSHPSAEGTLVSACVIYTVLTGNAGSVGDAGVLGLAAAHAQQLCDRASSTRCFYSTANTLCDFHCVDFNSDPGHCGACATHCAPGEICQDGACQ